MCQGEGALGQLAPAEPAQFLGGPQACLDGHGCRLDAPVLLEFAALEVLAHRQPLGEAQGLVERLRGRGRAHRVQEALQAVPADLHPLAARLVLDLDLGQPEPSGDRRVVRAAA